MEVLGLLLPSRDVAKCTSDRDIRLKPESIRFLQIEQSKCACSNISVSTSTRTSSASLCQGHHERGCRQRTIASCLPGCAPHCHGGAALTFHAQPNKTTANEALSPHRQHREGCLGFWDDKRNSITSNGALHRLRLQAHLVDERSPQSPPTTPEHCIEACKAAAAA